MTFETGRDTKVKLVVWDTTGDDTKHEVNREFYEGCHAVIVVYDVTNRDSFARIPFWLNEVQTYSNPVLKFLVGNKVDLEPVTSSEEAQRLAHKLKFDYFHETSATSTAISRERVVDLFQKLADYLVDKLYEGAIHVPEERRETKAKYMKALEHLGTAATVVSVAVGVATLPTALSSARTAATFVFRRVFRI